MHAISERLERRLFLSATLAEGVLTIDGTSGDDIIRVSQRGGQFTVREAGVAPFSGLAAEVGEIIVRGGDGNDRIRLNRVIIPAVIDGGAGDDRIYGGEDDDLILGGEGTDRLFGRGGHDEIDGGAGDDLLSGEAGDDDLIGGAGADRLSGGRGFDAADFDLDTITGVEDWPGASLFGASRFAHRPGIVLPVSGPPAFDGARPGFSAFPVNLTSPGFGSFPASGTILDIDTTGFDIAPVGSSTFSPLLSPQPEANFVFFRSGDGLFIRGRSADIQLQSDTFFATPGRTVVATF